MHQGLLETKFIVTTFRIKSEMFYFTGDTTMYKNITPAATHTRPADHRNRQSVEEIWNYER